MHDPWDDAENCEWGDSAEGGAHGARQHGREKLVTRSPADFTTELLSLKTGEEQRDVWPMNKKGTNTEYHSGARYHMQSVFFSGQGI